MSTKFSLDEIGRSMTNHGPDSDAYLDRETGEVIYDFDFAYFSEQDDCPEWRRGLESTSELMEKFPDRVLEITKLPSHESFSWMEEFAEAQAEPNSSILLAVLQERKPFRRFKDKLQDLPDKVLEDWYAFEESRYEAAVRGWLKDNDISIEEAAS